MKNSEANFGTKSAVLQALLWKELRENGSYAVLAAFCVVLANYQGYYSARADRSFDGFSSMTNWAVLLALLVGAALGALQIVPELRRDQWAFLRHRPATPGTIFGGKVLAGLVLYFAALGVPWLATILVAIKSGLLPVPFVGLLTKPLIIDVLLGPAFYFAAMLAALRPARWYGSRFLPFFAALLTSFFTMFVPDFSVALIIVLVGNLILGTAAWGSFVNSGNYGAQPRLAKWSLGITLYSGIALAVSIGCGWLINTLHFQLPTATTRYSEYSVSTDGRFVKVNYETEYGEPSVQRVTDLNGKALSDIEQVPYVGLHAAHGWDGYRRPQDLLRHFATDDNGVSWYFWRGANHVVGYSRKKRRIVRYMDAKGFTDKPANSVKCVTMVPLFGKSNRFIGNYAGAGTVFYDQSKVFDANFERKTTKLLFQAAPGEAIDGLWAFALPLASGKTGETVCLAALNRRLVMFDLQGKVLHSIPSPQNLTTITIFVTPEAKRLYLIAVPQGSRVLKATDPVVFYEYDSQNPKTLTEHKLPPLPPHKSAHNWWFVLMLPLLPPGLLAPYAICQSLNVPIFGYTELFADSEAGLPFSLLFTVSYTALLSGLLCGFGAWRVTQRCLMSPRAAKLWIVAVAALGIFGLLTLLALEGWPPRQKCPACGKKRAVTREICEHCAAPVAPLPQDGTEIFA